MVEQLAPQGWSPVDNIPSLNPVSVFSAAPQLMSYNLFTLRLLRSWNLLYSDVFPPTCDQPIRYHQIPNRKAIQRLEDDEKKKEEYHDLEHRLYPGSSS